MQQTLVPIAAIKGRGAASAIAHRYAVDAREAFDDGWHVSSVYEDDDALPIVSSIATQVRFEIAKSALSHN